MGEKAGKAPFRRMWTGHQPREGAPCFVGQHIQGSSSSYQGPALRTHPHCCAYIQGCVLHTHSREWEHMGLNALLSIPTPGNGSTVRRGVVAAVGAVCHPNAPLSIPTPGNGSTTQRGVVAGGSGGHPNAPPSIPTPGNGEHNAAGSSSRGFRGPPQGTAIRTHSREWEHSAGGVAAGPVGHPKAPLSIPTPGNGSTTQGGVVAVGAGGHPTHRYPYPLQGMGAQHRGSSHGCSVPPHFCSRACPGRRLVHRLSCLPQPPASVGITDSPPTAGSHPLAINMNRSRSGAPMPLSQQTF